MIKTRNESKDENVIKSVCVLIFNKAHLIILSKDEPDDTFFSFKVK